MFKGAISLGSDNNGRDWLKTTYPCGCTNKSSWVDGSMGTHSHNEALVRCTSHSTFSERAEPIVMLCLKRAMLEAGILPERNADWELMIRAMQSPHFAILVDEARKAAAPTGTSREDICVSPPSPEPAPKKKPKLNAPIPKGIPKIGHGPGAR
jgi:hypothetical protein